MWFTMGSWVSAVIRTFALSVLLCIVAAPADAVVITEFPIPTAASQPVGITAGADGALWFTEFGGNKIERITTTGTVGVVQL